VPAHDAGNLPPAVDPAQLDLTPRNEAEEHMISRTSIVAALFTSIEDSSAWTELFARDNCELRGENDLQIVIVEST